MRVLQICEPPDGGAALNAAEIALGLSAHGNEVEYAGPREARQYGELEAAGVPVHRLPLAPSYFRSVEDARALRAIDRLLRRGRFDLVHLHSAKAGALGRLAAARRGPRVVYSPHCFPFIGDLSRLRIAVATALERRLARFADAIVCVCEWEWRIALARRIAPAKRLHVIYNGSGPCDPTAAPEPSLAALGEDGPVVGAIAVMRRQKRLDLMIEAAPAILAGDPRARVAIVGNGPDRAALEAQAAGLGLDREQRFQILPFEGSSARYLAGLEVFVLPSEWEAFPISVLEALACGVPQVATDVGGTAEAVSEQTGLLVPPRRSDLLAAAALELLRDDERRNAMAAASRIRHRDNFLAELMLERTIDLYLEVVGAGAGRSSDAA